MAHSFLLKCILVVSIQSATTTHHISVHMIVRIHLGVNNNNNEHNKIMSSLPDL